MAIFQPTNITPDLISGEENGVVFVPSLGSDPVTVSWQVNGNSPLVAYQIDFYRNLPNEISPIATTNKVTLGTPFSPVSADGTVQRFSCQVQYNRFSAGAVALSDYYGKFQITQWWGATNEESVVQRSLSVYRTNYASSIEITNVTGMNGIYTFSGAFTPPNPDRGNTTLLWTRWIATNAGNVVYDTGKVWGATDYIWSPGVFYPGNYTVTFTAESSQGEALTASVNFTSMAGAVEVEGIIPALCDRSRGAVAVDLNLVMPESVGSANGSFTVTNSGLNLADGAYATWVIPDEFQNATWNILWEGNLDVLPFPYNDDLTIMEITMTDGSQAGFALRDDGLFHVFPNDIAITQRKLTGHYRFGITGVNNGDTVHCVFGIQATGDPNVTGFRSMSGFERTGIRSVKIFGTSETVQWGISWGEMAPQLVQYIWFTPEISEPFGENPHLSFTAEAATLASSLNAQTMVPFDTTAPLYRINPDGSILQLPVILAGEAMPIVYDYGAGNRNEYRYMTISGAVSGNDYLTQTVLYTPYLIPCFWEWTLIEAQRNPGNSVGNTEYIPVNVFRFRANVTSGSIGNGASPSVHSTFTRYPVVLRDTQNRKSGTLTGLIGWVTAPGEYTDDNATMEAIRNLSVTKNTLFLRSRRGEFMKVAISGEISTTANDNSPKQEIMASVPWVEIGPVDGSVVTIETVSEEVFP